jgi:hypothetical protein
MTILGRMASRGSASDLGARYTRQPLRVAISMGENL